MHLKSLTLRGFKSFASATTLRFEPGITCVVGPNGSGKSNVVDAIAWVMGEQGAKSLRGGKMEDVIFAGAAGRAPLGRAEVVLTIDNSDGALPIDYAEVTISRIMFRNGGSEYAINGDPCRLLDVQELLSDSGIGREMHVIVGQGQLDAVLQAGPDERRGFIEEAAGVLKHRKRKEKALRKLDAMTANLTRIQDLTGELRRQLKPLGKQAEVARRAATVQADLRDAKLRLAADDLVQMRGTLEQEVADETAVRQRRAVVERELAELNSREEALEREVAADAPRLAKAQELWYRLSSLRERFRGTASLAAERQRSLAAAQAEDEARAGAAEGRDPEALEAEAAAVREEHAVLASQLEAGREALVEAERLRVAREAELVEEERRVTAAIRAAADRREGLARLTGQVAAARSRVTAGEEEIERLAAALAAARERATAAQADYTALETQVAGLDEGEVGLDEQYEEATDALAAAETALAALQAEEREAERDRSALAARVEALQLGLARKDGSGALLAAGDRLPGLLGPVAELIDVESGAEVAIAAALGGAADAVAVSSLEAATVALALLKEDDAGRAGVLVGGATYDSPPWPALPDGARYAIDLVSTPDELRPALTFLLERVVVVEDVRAAESVVRALPSVRAATLAGDLVGTGWVVGGSAKAPSLLEIQAAVHETSERLREASHRCERLRFELGAAQERRTAAAADVEAALSRLHESDARMAAVAEQLAHLGSAARATAGEAERLEQARLQAVTAREQDRVALSELEARLEAASAAAPDDNEPIADGREALRVDVERLRAAEVETRLALRTTEERVRAAVARAEQLERAASSERAARERLVALRARRSREAVVAAAVMTGVTEALRRIETSLAAAAAEREAAEQARTVREGELLALRTSSRELAAELERLTDVVHRDEVARAEQRLRIEALETRLAEEFGLDGETVVNEYGPDVLVPPSVGEDGTVPEDGVSVPYDRAEQEKRLRAAERALALLGKVNPLALEEYAALEERHRFLSEQLEDLKSTRRDLLEIVKEVDERVQQVFAEAFADTAREFEVVFKTLFPGGDGKLVLSDPSDLLNTGVEVLARPAGKKVSRLSLLSGGERSLTALALLIAIFKARPSPFYVLDEVEAALDDRNLSRLLDSIETLRETSQLIVITHQKRTMEIADALYGVSMRGDGVSAVISQRMRESEPA